MQLLAKRLAELERQIRDQNDAHAAIERCVAAAEDVTLQLGIEIREELDDAVERMIVNHSPRSLRGAIRV